MNKDKGGILLLVIVALSLALTACAGPVDYAMATREVMDAETDAQLARLDAQIQTEQQAQESADKELMRSIQATTQATNTELTNQVMRQTEIQLTAQAENNAAMTALVEKLNQDSGLSVGQVVAWVFVGAGGFALGAMAIVFLAGVARGRQAGGEIVVWRRPEPHVRVYNPDDGLGETLTPAVIRRRPTRQEQPRVYVYDLDSGE